MVNTTSPFHFIIDSVVRIVAGQLETVMFVIFAFAVAMRLLIQYTVKREEWFAKELEKRINRFMDLDQGASHSFYVLAKRMMEQTFYELFEVRGIMKRRRMDYIMSPSDRIFLIHSGAARVVRDTLKQIKFLRYGEQAPKFAEISQSVFQNNPCFNRVFGVLPIGPFTNFLNALPGLFVVGGIFGTFLGIMKALPELSNMNLNDPDGTKQVMDYFLGRISFAMSSSVAGIMFSVLTQVMNTFLSPEEVFMDIVNRYELSLEYLWRRCSNNTLPEDIPAFDENRDPVEALAELSVTRELARTDRKMPDRRSHAVRKPATPETEAPDRSKAA